MNEMRALAAVVLLTVTSMARAQSHGLVDYSVIGATILPPDYETLALRAGWPETSVQYTRGLTRKLDAGLRLSGVYGVESSTRTQGGAALSLPLRWCLSRSPGLAVALHVTPGGRFYAYEPAAWGLQLPLGVALELPFTRHLRGGVNLDFHATLFVTGAGAPVWFGAPLAGPWLEWRLGRWTSLGVDTRVGAVTQSHGGGQGYAGGTRTRFGMQVQAVLATTI